MTDEMVTGFDASQHAGHYIFRVLFIILKKKKREP